MQRHVNVSASSQRDRSHHDVLLLGIPAAALLVHRLFRQSSALQTVRTVKFCKIPIESAERQMTGFAGNLQNETIRETQ